MLKRSADSECPGLKAVKPAHGGTLKQVQFILLCILMLGFYQLTLAGDKIKIKLHQPPPNKLGAGELWKLDITNTTREDINVYIQGTASEEKDGLIVDGKSKVFTVKPGKKTYGYNDFKSGEVSWKNKTYEEGILRTGNVKSGSYTICVTAFFENGSVADNEQCITQVIENVSAGMILLVSPSDGEELDPKVPVNFAWSAAGDKGPYSLKIVELKGDQSPETAIKENRPVFDKDGITGTSYTYSINDPKLEEGKKYAWMVKNGSSESEKYSFAMMSSQYQIIIDTVIVRCDTLTANKYYYQVKIRNNNPSGSPGPTNTAKTFITATTPVAAGITPALNTAYTVSYGNTVTISGTITFSSATSTIQFVVKMEDNSQPLIYNATAPYTVNLPNCNKNCCENFKAGLTQIQLTKLQKAGFYNFSGNLFVSSTKIKKISVEMAYFGLTVSDEACKKCMNNSNYWGNISNATLGGFTNSPVSYSGTGFPREFILTSPSGSTISGLPFSVTLVMPPGFTISCCKDVISFCIKISFTDTACQTCERIICKKYQRSNGVLTELFESLPKEKGKEQQIKTFEGEVQGKPGSDKLTDTTEYLDIENWKTFDTEKARRIIERKELDTDTKDNFLKLIEADYRRLNTEPVHMMSGIVVPDGCQNGNFEQQYSGWEGAYTHNASGLTYYLTNSGGFTTAALPMNLTAAYGSSTVQHNVEVAVPGTDALVPINKTHSGSYSMKINNNSVLYGMDMLTRSFPVTASTSNFRFWYALVLQDPGHGANSNPFFMVRIKNSGGSIVTSKTFSAVADVNNPFFQRIGSTVYRDWTCHNIDLSDLMGQQVTVEFIASDCAAGGHFGYAYIDDICTSCDGSSDGSININPSISAIADCVLPVKICGNFTLPVLGPVTGALQSITLSICHNGVVVATLINPVITGNQYCFTLNASDFPAVTSPPDGYDFVTTAIFTINSFTITKYSGTWGNGVTPGQNNDFKLNCAKECCKDFRYTGRFISIKPRGNISAGEWTLSQNISVAPLKVKKISAAIVFANFKTNPDCNVCVTNSNDFVNFLPGCQYQASGGITQNGTLIMPYNPPAKSSRNVFWGSDNTTPFTLNNFAFSFNIKLPPVSKLKCCADTISFCIRYKFTTEKCETCDTLVCYRVIQRGDGTYSSEILGPGSSQMNDNMNNDQNLRSAGINMSEPFDVFDGKEMTSTLVSLVLDSYSKVSISAVNEKGEERILEKNELNAGEYAINLEKSLAETGKYTLKLAVNDKVYYRDIKVAQITSQECNCTKK